MRAYCIPAKAGTKEFLIPLEFSSNDPAVLAEWLHLWPNANWVLDVVRSRYVVIDVDVKDGAGGGRTYMDLYERGLVPLTRTIQTPSGGLHLYYRQTRDVVHPGGCIKSILPGLDLPHWVLTNGSVVAAGEYRAVIEDEPITDAPQWLGDKIAERGRSF